MRRGERTMKTWTLERVAAHAGGRLLRAPAVAAGPERVTIDSRDAGPGALFVGLRGENDDGGRFANQALEAGAWGVITTPGHAEQAGKSAQSGVVIAADDPLKALHGLATAWRRHIAARVIGVTGSTGKTSTKDLLLALLAPHRRTVASRANFNTEIGLPLEILNAPAETEVLVLEMGMRGPGQIAELAAIAEPDVAVIVSIGPVHLELLGTVEAVAAAKAELIAGLKTGGTAIVPAEETLLIPHLRSDVRTVTFGQSGDVRLASVHDHDSGAELEIDTPTGQIALEVPFTQAHLQRNLLAATAAAQAVGVTPSGRVALVLSPGRGQRLALAGGVTLIDDCYNANPMSMQAALDDLRATAGRRPGARQVAILGDMLELGPDARRFHEQIGAYATQTHVDVLVAVGPLAAAMATRYDGELHAAGDAAAAARLAEQLIQPGDVVLVKASRGVGLELVCEAMMDEVRV
jgi:UDP-N-acetylmuramoyl-tripeptide--D-alanyl-D-alanine ligase